MSIECYDTDCAFHPKTEPFCHQDHCIKCVKTIDKDITAEELKVICDTVVRLIEIRQRESKHLCVENIAPKLMADLIQQLKKSVGIVRRSNR